MRLTLKLCFGDPGDPSWKPFSTTSLGSVHLGTGSKKAEKNSVGPTALHYPKWKVLRAVAVGVCSLRPLAYQSLPFSPDHFVSSQLVNMPVASRDVMVGSAIGALCMVGILALSSTSQTTYLAAPATTTVSGQTAVRPMAGIPMARQAPLYAAQDSVNMAEFAEEPILAEAPEFVAAAPAQVCR